MPTVASISPNASFKVLQGQPFTLQCLTSGDFPSSFQWVFSGNGVSPVTLDQLFTTIPRMTSHFNITRNNSVASYSGNYRCIVQNQLIIDAAQRTSSAEINVTVQGMHNISSTVHGFVRPWLMMLGHCFTSRESRTMPFLTTILINTLSISVMRFCYYIFFILLVLFFLVLRMLARARARGPGHAGPASEKVDPPGLFKPGVRICTCACELCYA